MRYLGIIISVALFFIITITGFNFGVRAYADSFYTLKQEAMQSLGQKNNSLTVWIALTFINPLTALGPVFYILYHNIIISIQLYLHGKGLKS